MNPSFSLAAGFRAVVIGGAGDIGAAIASLFCDLGATVTATGVNDDDIARTQLKPRPGLASGRRKIKGNMDIELVVDAMELAGHIDRMVLFSGDGNFQFLVGAMQRRDVRVTVVSTISSQPPMIADELRRQADVFTDLNELRSKVGRDSPDPREPRPYAPQSLDRATMTLRGKGKVDV